MNEMTLREQLITLSHLMVKERMASGGHPEEGMGKDAWRGRLLMMIQAKPGVTMQELMRMGGRRMPMTEELLLGLAKKGYLTLTPMEGNTDQTVQLTELGQKEAGATAPGASALDALTPEEQQTLSGYLSRMTDALREKMDDGDMPDLPEMEGMWMGGAFGGMGRGGMPFSRPFMDRHGPRDGWEMGCTRGRG